MIQEPGPEEDEQNTSCFKDTRGRMPVVPVQPIHSCHITLLPNLAELLVKLDKPCEATSGNESA